MAERVFLRRDRDGSMIDLYVPSLDFLRPRTLPSQRVQSGSDVTTTVQTGRTTVTGTTTLSVSDLGPDEANRIRAELLGSLDTWTLYTPGWPGEPRLMIGTTSEQRDQWQASRISLELQQINEFSAVEETIGATQPRADAAAGLAPEVDLGTVTTQEPDAEQRSYLAQLLGL